MDSLACRIEGDADASGPLPRPGALLARRYQLVRVLGEGGMGVVFEAVHLKLQRRVAIKLLHPSALALPDAAARFEREARATARIACPQVARVLDVDAADDGAPFMVMELLSGRDLEAELRERKRLPLGEAIDLLLQACAAMSAAHAAGVVHRDLKPSNLFLVDENGHRVVKVLDFGISKIEGEEEPPRPEGAETVGTPAYMSPEQLRSSDDVDARTDVWSLAVILYEMLAGEPPFHGTTTAAIAAIVADLAPQLREVRPELPRDLDRVLARALAKDPRKRYATVEELAAALAPFADPAYERAFGATSGTFAVVGDVPRPSAPPSARAIAQRRRSRIVKGGAAVAAALATIASIMTARAYQDHRPAAQDAGGRALLRLAESARDGAYADLPDARRGLSRLRAPIVEPRPAPHPAAKLAPATQRQDYF